MISLYSGRIEERDIVKRLVAWFHRGNVKVSEMYRRLTHRFERAALRQREQKAPAVPPAQHPHSLEALAVEIMHEVRNPLGSIALYASLIQQQPAGETARWANEILRSSHRLQATISQLLAFATEPHLAAEWVSVTELFQEATDATFSVWHSGQWTIETKIPEDLPALWGDRTLLTQALSNLLLNATEAMPKGGIVTIRAYQSTQASSPMTGQRAVAIQVEDTGTGVAPCHRDKIFTPFFTTKQSGTGVGLALTQKIIHAHHGTIEFSDASVCGTCFTVLLPIGSEHAPVSVVTNSASALTPNEA